MKNTGKTQIISREELEELNIDRDCTVCNCKTCPYYDKDFWDCCAKENTIPDNCSSHIENERHQVQKKKDIIIELVIVALIVIVTFFTAANIYKHECKNCLEKVENYYETEILNGRYIQR